jgi:hypothetical protein
MSLRTLFERVALVVIASSLSACGEKPPPEVAPTVEVAALGEAGDPYVLAVPGTSEGIPATQFGYTYVRLDMPAQHDGLRVAVKASADVTLSLVRDAYNGGYVDGASGRVRTFFVPAATVSSSTSFFLAIYTSRRG